MRISFDEARATLAEKLEKVGCPPEKARVVADEMARNSLEGTYSHGIHRFPRLMRNIRHGDISLDASPALQAAFGALERYDGGMGLGIPNAVFAADRAIALAREHGVGVVALAHTNHWLRAATYAYRITDAGMAALCFSNTQPNMPAWGALDTRLGNNPVAMAFPREGGAVLVDLAMTQFSYGKLEIARMNGREMPADAGFDADGNLTRDPAAVLATRRLLSIGQWKGAGLSLLLDLFASCISLGNCVAAIGRLPGDEIGLSQLFIAINYRKVAPQAESDAILNDALDSLLHSAPADPARPITFPGLRAARTRAENLKAGIPVEDADWAEILAM